MKKIFTPLAIVSALVMSSSVFAADLVGVNVSTTYYGEGANNSDSTYTSVSGSDKVLNHELVTYVNLVGGVAYSIQVLNEDGNSHTYSVNSDTLVIDAMTGEPKDFSILNTNTKYYMISDAKINTEVYPTTSYLQAIIVNVPDGARCPTLHSVTGVNVTENNSILTLDNGMGNINLSDNMSIFQIGNPKPLYINPAEVKIGDRALVWSSISYQAVDAGKNSKPYQMMIIGEDKELDKDLDWQFQGNTQQSQSVETTEPIQPAEPTEPAEPVTTNGVPVPDIPEELLQNIPNESVTMATPRALSHETVVSTEKNQNGVVEYISSTDADGITTKYTIDEHTLIIDSMSGKVLTLDNVQAGEKLYIYGNSPKPEINPPINYAQAVLLNIPMGGGVPAMYKVTDVTFENGATQILVDDVEAKRVTLNNNMSISSLISNDVTGRSGIAIGNRIFVWYENLFNNTEEIDTADRKAVQMVIASSLVEDQTAQDKISMPAMVHNNRAYIGLRNASEKIGLEVTWNANTKTTTITSDRRTMDIQVGQTSYLSRPTGENMLGMAAPTILGESFIGLDGNLYVDPMVFEVLGGYTVNMKTSSNN